jgi:limonene-1,2-epoxide hydrolase
MRTRRRAQHVLRAVRHLEDVARLWHLATLSDTRAPMDDPVQIFEQCVDALNRVDRTEILRLVDPQIVFIPMRAAVTGPFIGHAGMEEFLLDNEDKYEYFRAEFDTLERLPDGRLLSLGTIRVKGRGGEDETCVQTAGIAEFKDGRMLSWHDYGDETTARAKANKT